jgi:hypothetical protein
VIPPGYTWNTAPFPFRKYCRMLTLCWQKAGGKAPAFARARYDDEEQMFCQIRVLLAFVQICTHHICCTINKALQLKNNFLQLRCVFCHRVFFLKKTSRQICTYSSIYVRSTAEIAVGQKIYLYAGLCRNVLSIRIICGSFGNVDSFERTRRESEEEQGITETLT